ncbi:MAG: FecR domain-containing protein [Prolixibacteraceae bacterium]|nr:FecR domain-containing protein [Prolixibacteraceae bacterium]
MKQSIYSLLEKHFQQQTNLEEEQQIEQFKQSKLQEYIVLKNLWQSNASINITDFDAEKAWKKVIKSQTNRKSIAPLRRIAAVAIVLIIGSLLAFYLMQRHNDPVMMEAYTQAQQIDSVLLADGTTVWLNRNSKLYYPKKFNGESRTVKLEGEAFFAVTKNPKKPFKIATNHSTVTVLGTTLNVNTDSLKTEVTVSTGKVNVKSAFSESNINLLPDDVALATKSGVIKSQITNPNYLSWKTGVFLFEDTPLRDVVHDLNTFYAKPIILDKDLEDLQFSARFEKTEQKDILEILKITLNLTIMETPNNYEIN